MRKQLTDDEFNAISHLTRSTKLDSVYDIITVNEESDAFINYETNAHISLKAGLELLYESLAYPLQHEGLDTKETNLIINLFKEFEVTKDNINWLSDDYS